MSDLPPALTGIVEDFGALTERERLELLLVHLFFSAPPEAPTTRGFAGILREALDGLSAAEVLAVPPDVPDRLGLAHAVSPLRLRGMSAMLSRVKRQIEKALAA